MNGWRQGQGWKARLAVAAVVTTGLAGGGAPAACAADGAAATAPAAATSPAPAPALTLTAARAAIEDGLYDLARTQIEAFVRSPDIAPADQAAAFELLLRSLHGLGQTDAMLRLTGGGERWTRTLRETPAASYWMAVAWYETNQVDKALETLAHGEAGLRASPYDAPSLRLQARCHVRQGKLPEALACFEQVDRQYGDTPVGADNRLEWGRALLAAGQPTAAAAVLRRLSAASTAATPAGADGGYWLGLALAEAGQPGEALGAFLAVGANTNATADTRGQAWFAAARMHQARTNLTEAAACITRGRELVRTQALKLSGQAELARLLLELGRLEEGLPLAKAFILAAPMDPRAADLQLRLADALIAHQRGGEGVNEYQHYLETYTNAQGQAEAHYGRGWGLMVLGRHAEAAAAFGKAQTLFTDPARQARALFRMGDAYLANAQAQLSADTYTRFLDLYPDNPLAPQAHLQLAASHEQAARTTEAAQTYRDLILRHPAVPEAEEAHWRLARMQEAAGRWAEASAIYDTMMQAYPRGALAAEALYGRGRMQCRLYRFAAALEDFTRVVRDLPASRVAEEAAYLRAMCHYWLNRDDEALALCDAFRTAHPQSRWAADALFWTGEYYYNRDRPESAEERFTQFATLYPQHPLADTALLLAGKALVKRKEYLRALDVFEQLVKAHPDSARLAEARFAQADTMFELGRFAEAILVFDEVIAKYPDNELVPAAWGRRGDCQFTLGTRDPTRYAEAIRCYQTVARTPNAPADLVLQAEYKIGRCLEKQEKTDEALEQYYARVMVRFLDDRQKRVWQNQAAKLWFTRAALDAAHIYEARQDWRNEVRIFERVTQAGVPAAAEVQARIEKLKAEHWWRP